MGKKSQKIEITDSTYMLYSEDEHSIHTTVVNRDEEKVILDHQEYYGKEGEQQKNVGFNYNDDGTLSHWTVENRKSTVIDEGDKVTITTAQYEKDDIKAITSGDVPGYAYIDANRPEYFGKDNEPVWAKRAKEKADKKITAKKNDKKKQTAKALKVQKESQLVKGLKEDNGWSKFSWADDSQKKMTTKTSEKSKLKKKPERMNVQISGGRS